MSSPRFHHSFLFRLVILTLFAQWSFLPLHAQNHEFMEIKLLDRERAPVLNAELQVNEEKATFQAESGTYRVRNPLTETLHIQSSHPNFQSQDYHVKSSLRTFYCMRPDEDFYVDAAGRPFPYVAHRDQLIVFLHPSSPDSGKISTQQANAWMQKTADQLGLKIKASLFERCQRRHFSQDSAHAIHGALRSFLATHSGQADEAQIAAIIAQQNEKVGDFEQLKASGLLPMNCEQDYDRAFILTTSDGKDFDPLDREPLQSLRALSEIAAAGPLVSNSDDFSDCQTYLNEITVAFDETISEAEIQELMQTYGLDLRWKNERNPLIRRLSAHPGNGQSINHQILKLQREPGVAHVELEHFVVNKPD